MVSLAMKNRWKKVIVTAETSIRETLKVIDSECLRIALVTDSEYSLLGVVTDGDIRRGLLSGISLDKDVSLIMNKSPQVSNSSTPKSELIDKMGRLDLLSIPLIKNNRVVGLQTLTEGITKSTYLNPIFLMAGGFGTRLSPLTKTCPKPLLKVGDCPILERTLTHCIKSGFVNFYISTHYLPEMIQEYFGDGKKWGVSITYVHEQAPLGTAGALGLLPDNTPNLPIIVINGDILTTIDIQNLLNFHNTEESIATMCVSEYEYQIPYGVIQGRDGKISHIDEKPKHRIHINAGIYVLDSHVVKNIKKNRRVDMPELLDSLINKQQTVSMFPIHEYWLDIGSKTDFSQAQKDIQTLDI